MINLHYVIMFIDILGISLGYAFHSKIESMWQCLSDERSDEPSHFQRILVVCSYVVLQLNCPSWCEVWATSSIFNPDTFFNLLYIPKNLKPYSFSCKTYLFWDRCSVINLDVIIWLYPYLRMFWIVRWSKDTSIRLIGTLFGFCFAKLLNQPWLIFYCVVLEEV